MRWTAAGVCALCSISMFAGCRSSNNRADLVEAELRTRERQIDELQEQLARERALNSAYDRDSRLRSSEPGTTPIVEGISPGMPIKSIEIGRGTGGVDEDGITGDEGVQIVVVPRDEDRAAIKLPGTLSVSVYEITPDGLKVPFTTWDVSSIALRGTWQSGLFGSGYHVRLRFRNQPTQNKLRLVVQFRTLDGRVLEADREIAIRVVQMASQQPIMISPMVSPMMVYPQPDLGRIGPPLTLDPTLLPQPNPVTSNRTSNAPPVELLSPIPFVDSPAP